MGWPNRATASERVTEIRHLTWEPPWGIEPQTYALREARQAALGTLPAQIAALTSRNALCAQSARIPGPRPGPRPGQPPVTECYQRGPGSPNTRPPMSRPAYTRTAPGTRPGADQDSHADRRLFVSPRRRGPSPHRVQIAPFGVVLWPRCPRGSAGLGRSTRLAEETAQM
jgi:hypothetical protein